MSDKTFSAWKRSEIEQKIDAFLIEGRPFRSRYLIMPVAGSVSRFKYRGLQVRAWTVDNNTRFDAAVELL